MTRSYSWAGHGNLGDDWIAEVGQLLLQSTPVRETRCLWPACLGAHRLSGHHSRSVRGESLVLWGGGWLASDRPGSDTMIRWNRHIRDWKGPLFGFGLGLGPFDSPEPSHRAATKHVLGRLEHPIFVRCAADLEQVPGGLTALAADVALLDPRFGGDRAGRQPLTHTKATGGADRYVAISLPRYSSHWAARRPWLTESWYQDWVRNMLNLHLGDARGVFVEFDTGPGAVGDAAYWGDLAAQQIRPRSVQHAAQIFADADWALVGRLHAGIMAAVVGTPVMALAYHHKFAVLEELGVSVAGLREIPQARSVPTSADDRQLAHVRERGMRAFKRFSEALESPCGH